MYALDFMPEIRILSFYLQQKNVNVFVCTQKRTLRILYISTLSNHLRNTDLTAKKLIAEKLILAYKATIIPVFYPKFTQYYVRYSFRTKRGSNKICFSK